MRYVLGIDGGGSKTVCVLMNDARQVIGRGEAGPSNYQSIGIAATLKSIQSAIHSAVTSMVTIEAICLGLAGVGRVTDIEVVKVLVQELQNSKLLPIIWDLQPSNIVICNDALIALVGGIGHDVGIVVAVGTGSIVFGRNHQGDTKRVGGWGYILGDEGSAYKIAVAGMQAALKSYDGREISTSLVESFKQHLRLTNIEDLIEVIYRRGWGVKEIAALAPIIDLVAALGDEVANKIIDDAVQELVKATSTVINAIFNHDSVLEVVTAGSVWRGRCKMHERFAASIINNFPRVKVIFPRSEPAYGAGLLALQKLS
ncbi:ATPase [Nostocaceae cyanobacterium CENA357]|uniref:ATPase n=1 Tax=Atlanticothrix silvestris CENA357 TaxID=1725252 RepID=A0A8J7HLM5_9CYAN|nr:BadF/BadG/BcrA/BcrD ATPase family protein [Atlanticothrix silvestris]MBH8554485.1 ATPase [Atlanticothrix silvestris CENA357]